MSPEQLAQQQAEAAAGNDKPILHPSGKLQDAKSGKFLPGNSGGAGRPKGSRNKVTIACEELLEGEGEKLTRKAIGPIRRYDGPQALH